jgi:hypothetical protein
MGDRPGRPQIGAYVDCNFRKLESLTGLVFPIFFLAMLIPLIASHVVTAKNFLTTILVSSSFVVTSIN